MAELCVTCATRKAQRDCPALSNRVCSQCCGRGRRRTIDCPDNCPHFVTGLQQAVARLARAGGDPEFEQLWGDMLHNFRLALLRVRQGRVRDLTDEEARAAFANAADTMRTRSKGLIYDFRSPDPRIQWIADALLEVANGHEQGARGLRRASAAELAACLRHLEKEAKWFASQQPGGSGFLDLACQSVGHVMVGDDGRWQSPEKSDIR